VTAIIPVFFVIERRASFLNEGDKTSLIFATKNLPGALHHCLGAFAERGVNMTKLESRPRRDRFWEYVFFVDIEGHSNEEKISRDTPTKRRSAPRWQIW